MNVSKFYRFKAVSHYFGVGVLAWFQYTSCTSLYAYLWQFGWIDSTFTSPCRWRHFLGSLEKWGLFEPQEYSFWLWVSPFSPWPRSFDHSDVVHPHLSLKNWVLPTLVLVVVIHSTQQQKSVLKHPGCPLLSSSSLKLPLSYGACQLLHSVTRVDHWCSATACPRCCGGKVSTTSGFCCLGFHRVFEQEGFLKK